MRLAAAGFGFMRRRSSPFAWALVLFGVGSVPATGQSVAGRVIDAATGEGIAGVRITMIRGDGARMTQVVSGDSGTFRVGATRTGLHRLEARHIAYPTVTTENFRLESEQLLVVDIRMGEAIALEPLVVTGTRRDVRNDATHDGFYARHVSLPPIGNARAIGRNDPEMINARDAFDVMTWLPRPFCLVVYWNGHMAASPGEAAARMETIQYDLEGIEFYRYIQYAPGHMRDYPGYLAECTRHSVLALWSRTGHFADLPPDTTPSSRRVAIASAAYHLAGPDAPGVGHGLEGTAHWPVNTRTAIGLTLRQTRHMLDAATTSTLTPPIVAPLFVTPPGPRPLTLLSGSAEVRALLQPRGRLWPVVAGRVIVARRSLMLVSSSDNGVAAHVTSRGYGLGGTVGGEVVLGGRFAVSAALGHDRVFFGPYSQIEHRTNRTSAHWGGTLLRIGAGFALER